MSLEKLECSICEFVFEADVRASGQVRCICCGHSFSPPRSAAHPSALPVSQSPLSDVHRSEDHRSEIHRSIDQEDSQDMIGRADQVRSSILLQRIKARRRSNLILLLLFIATLVSGALVAQRFISVEKQRQQQIADSKFSVIETANHLDTATEPLPPAPTARAKPILAANPPLSAKPSVKPEAPVIEEAPELIAKIPVAPPKFPFLSSTVAVDQAAIVKPYMMLLEIESPTGTTYATGTIVDSRGYLLTSLAAATGATKITVSSARSRSQIKNVVTPPVSDTVRGVIAVSNAQQWALLEINRRFVLNAADIRLLEIDRIVSRQPLLRMVAPRSSKDYAVSEMRVDQRRRSSKLAAGQKELLNIADGDADVNWIISPRSPYDQLGAALVSPEGKLMAVLVNFDQNSSYYINTSAIGKLLKGNNFSKKPLSSLK